jgi:hypothetical protein
MPLDIAKLLKIVENTAYRPLSETDLNEAERQLGFALPDLLRKIYCEVGDGGFGPGYGFYRLLEGTDEFPDETVVQLYTSFRELDPEDPSWSWPEKLLPLLDWGCAIRSCVHCSDPTLPVFRFDPNSGSIAVFSTEGYSFENWLEAWLDGKDLW